MVTIFQVKIKQNNFNSAFFYANNVQSNLCFDKNFHIISFITVAKHPWLEI